MQVIETERLRLRGWQGRDEAFLPAILADLDVMAFSDTGPLDGTGIRAWLRAATA